MQNVAWAMISVRKPNGMPTWRKAALSEMPVTMPGNAIGSTIIRLNVLRPKNR